MNKKLVGVCLTAMLTFISVLPVHAETHYGESGWNVTFTSGKELESNFKTANFNDAMKNVQPGDKAVFTISITNQNSNTTDWYMTNKVVRSMEDNSVANGGAYTYRLVYIPSDGGAETILYDSETVGGEITGRVATTAAIGLHEATNSLEEYFFLDTLEKNQSGKVTLEVGLDGETQESGYQDTLADLTINFAVERRPSPQVQSRRVELVQANTVRTADDNRVILFTILTLISGLMLLTLSIYCRKVMRKEEE